MSNKFISFCYAIERTEVLSCEITKFTEVNTQNFGTQFGTDEYLDKERIAGTLQELLFKT